MPSINTSHYVSSGKWDVNHRKCSVTGNVMFDVSLVVDHIEALHVVGLSAADLDELIHELKSARQDADLCRMADRVERLLPRAGEIHAEAARPPLGPSFAAMDAERRRDEAMFRDDPPF